MSRSKTPHQIRRVIAGLPLLIVMTTPLFGGGLASLSLAALTLIRGAGDLADGHRAAWVRPEPDSFRDWVVGLFPVRVLAGAMAGAISGTTFDDLNANGTREVGEPGLAGITVLATDNLGNTVTTTTDSSGNYTLASLPGTEARVEFGPPVSPVSAPNDQYVHSVAGGTSVQFVSLTGNQTGINAGFINRSKWCQNNMRLAVPCWAYGQYNHASLTNEPVLVSVPYATTLSRNNQTYLANSPQLGSTWGVAYQQSTGIIFTTAVIRRHTDTGPQGLAGLYALRTSGNKVAQAWSIDLNTLSNTFGAALTRDLTSKTAPSHDTAAFDKVGKTGIGDIDLSEDGNTLWVVNLEARALVRLDVTNGGRPTSLTSFNLAAASGTPTCTNGVLRPWGLKLANGRGYLGVVCTGETATGTPTQTRANLSAHVLSFDPTINAGALAFTREIDITDLTFQRGLVWNRPDLNLHDGASRWNSWQAALDPNRMCAPYFAGNTPRDHCLFPTPILSDIEFDDGGNMILGFIDRTSIQLTGYNYGLNADTTFYQSFSGGDMLRACLVNGSYQLESNGVCGGVAGSGVGNGEGPGGGEFYARDIWINPQTLQTVHRETMQGGLAVLKGFNPAEIVSVMMDPITYYSGGLGWFRNTDGGRIKVYEIFDQSANFPPIVGGSFKATGLGDLELYCPGVPLELGNRVWLDSDGDGIQDADEMGIDGIAVSLYRQGILVGQTTTANGGKYLFDLTNVNLNGATGLDPNSDYEIVIPVDAGPASAYILSPRDRDGTAGGNLRDSDAALVGTRAVIAVTTGTGGEPDHNLDFGFAVAALGLRDPGVCLSPGGLYEFVVRLGNPTSFVAADTAGPEMQIDLPAGIASVLSTRATTTSSGAGTVSVNGATQILWNGALNPGDTLTLIYQVQLAPLPLGTVLCTRSTAAYDANNDGTKESTSVIDFCAVVSCPLAGAGVGISPTSEPSDQKAGSVLIYNLYTSSINASRQDTRFTLTNTNPVSPVYLHLFFVDGQTCSSVDRFISLTPSQTTSFLASDLDPERTGYLIAVATDETGCPRNFNYLIGDEYVRFESGHQANLKATAVTAIGQVPCTTSTVTATLAFDGIAYNHLPRALAADSLTSVAEGNQTMLVVNRLGGNLAVGGPPLGRLFGLLYDDAETSASFTLNSAGCQLRGIVSNNFPRVVPRYDQFVPAGRSGWLKLWAESDQGLLGSLINFNAVGGFSNGHNLHFLTMTGSVSYTIPVYPPF